MPDKSKNWGGFRPGSGNKFKWNSGETKPIRIPVKLHEAVLSYAKLIDGQFPNGLQPSEALACKLPRTETKLETVTQSKKLQEQVEILEQAVKNAEREKFELVTKLNKLEAEKAIRDRKPPLDGVTVSSDFPGSEQAVEVLESALKLKANAGGAIKREIKKALNFLGRSRQG